MADVQPVPVIAETIEEVEDRRRMSEGIRAAMERERDFSSRLEAKLAGIAMVPEARELMTQRLTNYWSGYPATGGLLTDFADAGGYRSAEIVIGAGFHAAVYCANRVRLGYKKPIVLERGNGEKVGGAFAISLSPVFRLNSRNRPGKAGLPDQDKALNYLPGGPVQPSMITSEEYPTNADMAWLIRLTLAQYADVRTGVTVTGIGPGRQGISDSASITVNGQRVDVGRVIDARGTGMVADEDQADEATLTFAQLMQRMGGMFPLRGMKQVAVIGGGDSARCAVESLLGIAPGNTSAIGLDYVDRVDWYTSSGLNAPTCSEYREQQRGRYIRIAQYLEGNESNPSTRLRVMGRNGYDTPLDGETVLVNDRTYDMAVKCTGGKLPELKDSFNYFPITRDGGDDENGVGTTLASKATPFESYRIGPAADIPFSRTEETSGVSAIPANRVAMFRLAPRTAALASVLKPPLDRE